MKNRSLKIAVGMSGGVDSSLAASLLVEAGHEVTGVYLDCWGLPGCGVDENRKDAMRVGLKLGIPMKVLDLKKKYQEKVMDWFFEEVKAGRTPNPDVLCNKEIKFGMFLDWAISVGFEKIATGHFARQKPMHLGGQARLLQAKDKHKDQTYFLAMLKPEQLEKVLFPIGGMTKKEVRKEAKKRGLHVFDKKSTSGICFIGHKISFEELLKTRIKEHEGEVVNLKNKVIGRHKGYEFYTVGQRHGFEVVVKTSESKPLFVVSKDKKKNRLVVGEKKELFRDSFEVEKWSFIGKKFEVTNLEFLVRIRHGGKLVKCVVEPCIPARGETLRVSLKERVFGVAPGQVAVLYKKTVGTVPTVFECLGGGVIGGGR